MRFYIRNGESVRGKNGILKKIPVISIFIFAQMRRSINNNNIFMI